MSYNRAMFGKWLPKTLLLALLISAQALYVSHVYQHLNDNASSCSICLQASAGGNAIAVSSLLILEQSPSCELLAHVEELACQAATHRKYQSRAPPLS